MKRPASATIFGIFNIVWGFLGVCSLTWALIMRFGLIPGLEDDPVIERMASNSGYQAFTIVSEIFGAVATVVILAAGFGLLQMRHWARLATIGWAAYSILMVIVGSLLNFFLIFRPLINETGGPERIALMFGLGFTLAIMTFIGAYCVVAIFFMTRPKLIAAMDEAAGSP